MFRTEHPWLLAAEACPTLRGCSLRRGPGLLKGHLVTARNIESAAGPETFGRADPDRTAGSSAAWNGVLGAALCWSPSHLPASA